VVHEIKHSVISDAPQEIHNKYQDFKLAMHGNIDNVAMAMSSEVWAMYIGEHLAVVFQFSDASGGRIYSW
jgi:hypothetical protein